MEKPLDHYLQVQSPYYQVAQYNHKTLILKVTGHVCEHQKMISKNINYQEAEY